MTELPPEAACGAADELLELARSWLRDLKPSSSKLTLKTYRESIEAFAAYLRRLDDPPESLAEVDRGHVREWMIALKEDGKADGTIGTRFRNLRSLLNWLVAEEELPAAPTAGMREPKVVEQPVAVVPPDLLLQVLETCDSSFLGRRDEAVIRAFADGGMRLAELVHLELDDLDMDLQTFRVPGKGGKERAVPFGVKTARALDRYLRARRRHPKAKEHPTPLWLGHKGPLREDGVYRMIGRRAERAGIGYVHPHQLRHTAAHQLRLAGMNDQDMRRIFGWGPNSRMLERYGASAADERAREAHRRLSFGDQL